MSVSCDPNDLSLAASYLRGMNSGQIQAVKTSLICSWANALLPPVNMDISDTSLATNIILSWVNQGAGQTTNEVWKSTDGVTFNLFTTVPGTANGAFDNSGTLGVGQMHFYKVRGCNASGCGNFGPTVAVSNVFTAPNAPVNFPVLIRNFGTFTATAGAAITSVSMPMLRKVDGNLNLSSNANLTSVTLTALQTVGGSLFLGASMPFIISLPNLLTVGIASGDLQFHANNNVTSISCPKLTTVAGNFIFFSCPALTSVDLSSLQTVGVAGNGRLDWNTDPLLASISFPSLTQVRFSLNFNACTGLQTINIPQSGFTITGLTGVVGNGCTVLTNWQVPGWVIPNNQVINIQNASLTAASVNSILARAVAPPTMTGGTINLNLGASSAPTGQGVIDKATLIGNGVTVNTN